jgi:steroid delta-isomerase-like uncharacterized protein
MSAEQHKATIRRMFDEGMAGNLDIFDAVIAPDYVGHNPSSYPGDQEMHGPQSQKDSFADVRASFPDLRATLEQLVAEDDRAALRVRYEGTFTNAFAGIPANGNAFSLTYNIHYRFDSSGKIAEEWLEWDTLGVMQILGVLPVNS